ncbi:MAG: 4Fe-4S dicluster domain-containing protein [Arhodomonas sp.]|nr:4Fe-4S dicluster domain-containing protein [Arhodomonas sp.]
MQTHLADFIRDTDAGREADAILRKCTHCGFCLANCPTYRLWGDELDSPRGRIYQVKQVLEGAEPTESLQIHLDRCLTCRACETTCPSGVEYGRLADLGARLSTRRPAAPRAGDALGATHRAASAAAVRCPARARPHGPATGPDDPAGQDPAGAPCPALAGATPGKTRPNAGGLRQPALDPVINPATARVADGLLRGRPHPRGRLLRRGQPAPGRGGGGA